MKYGRVGHSMIGWKDGVYVFYGRTGKKEWCDAVEKFTISTNTWEEIPQLKMDQGLEGVGIVRMNVNSLLMFGGERGEDKSNDVYMVSLQDKRMDKVAKLTLERGYA